MLKWVYYYSGFGGGTMLFFRKFFIKMIQMKNKFLFLTSFFFILFSSVVIYWLEPQTFEHPFNGLWWVMTTLTTVGYGDYYPSTIEGKLFAMFLYLTGIGLIGVLIGKIVEGFAIMREKKEAGKMGYLGTDHIVIIGWSRKSQFAIREILSSHPETEIVLVDQLEKTPLSEDRFHFVCGDASQETSLIQANIAKAKAAILFADDKVADPSLADGKSLLIATTIERLAPRVHTTVEIMTEEHIQNFKHIKVDEFILSDETISHMAVLSAFANGIPGVISQLLSRNTGADLYQIGKRPHWKTYRDAYNQLLEEGATLLADGANLTINQRLDVPIPEEANLLIICEKNIYEKITE